MIHYDFEGVEGRIVPNRGLLGGSATIVGDAFTLIEPERGGIASSSIQLSNSTTRIGAITYVGHKSDTQRAWIGWRRCCIHGGDFLPCFEWC